MTQQFGAPNLLGLTAIGLALELGGGCVAPQAELTSVRDA